MTVMIRPAERRGADALGKLGAMLVQEHYDFDRQRFLAPTPGTARGYGAFLGSMAESLAEQPTETAFDKGVARFTWLMVRFIMVMAPLVFLINGLTKVVPAA